MLLKRIADKLPSELASLIPELESAGIKTTESIIFTHQPTIISSTTTLNSQQLEAFIWYCIRLTPEKSRLASDVDNCKIIGPWLGFGVKGLDELLGDWDGVGVLEIAGPRKVGKSKAIGQAAEPRTKILIIDNIFTHFKDRLTNTSAQGLSKRTTIFPTDRHTIVNATVTCIPTNPLSRFNKLNIKPALGSSFTYTTDATLLVQETGKVFGMLDEEERERIKKAPGLRGSVEVVRSRVSHLQISHSILEAYHAQ
ncbi:hypothetical protein I307_03611 [Cryptococcus deuterogattii 99/473]|uniref:Uncharacterized protein n=1 Tax=Cryptococcus deuterogattii Ram5 TaxID=1296110 RepID=A0A0D0U522_9TREE|nr:hypothetical protein I313_00150 [Cryptococcus deuterogattii Ram5]KIY56874.1 hypothetical protein I307_03611 [Cryptococcus deuterogattii 99/473]